MALPDASLVKSLKDVPMEDARHILYNDLIGFNQVIEQCAGGALPTEDGFCKVVQSLKWASPGTFGLEAIYANLGSMRHQSEVIHYLHQIRTERQYLK